MQSGMYVFIIIIIIFICELKCKQKLPVVAQAHYSSDKGKYKTAGCAESLPFVIIVLLRGAPGPFYFLSDD